MQQDSVIDKLLLREVIDRAKNIVETKTDMTRDCIHTSMILPLFKALGYDVFENREFFINPEMETQVGADYIVFYKGEPMLIIALLRSNDDVEAQIMEIEKMFSRLMPFYGILTDGINYKIFEGLLRGRVPDVMSTAYGWYVNLATMTETEILNGIRRFARADIGRLGTYV